MHKDKGREPSSSEGPGGIIIIKSAKKKIKKALEGGLKGPDMECKYYPCHKGLGDCTWCYCPFYPCDDPSTGGRWKKHSRTGERIFSCIDCSWIHRPEVARRVYVEIDSMVSFDEAKLHKIRKGLLEELK